MNKFFKGFYHAFEGIKYAFQTQVNMRFHVIVAVIVIMLGVVFKLSVIEWSFIALAITLVLSAELFNTAIESLTDLATQEIHPLAKVAKDCAAAAVLLMAIFAVVIAGLVFVPHFLA